MKLWLIQLYFLVKTVAVRTNETPIQVERTPNFMGQVIDILTLSYGSSSGCR
tara:strand:- start:176 stop:331 length:156 start_codon:yes stop_codon:yes gene_type:complete